MFLFFSVFFRSQFSKSCRGLQKSRDVIGSIGVVRVAVSDADCRMRGDGCQATVYKSWRCVNCWWRDGMRRRQDVAASRWAMKTDDAINNPRLSSVNCRPSAHHRRTNSPLAPSPARLSLRFRELAYIRLRCYDYRSNFVVSCTPDAWFLPYAPVAPYTSRVCVCVCLCVCVCVFILYLYLTRINRSGS